MGVSNDDTRQLSFVDARARILSKIRTIINQAEIFFIEISSALIKVRSVALDLCVLTGFHYQD